MENKRNVAQTATENKSRASTQQEEVVRDSNTPGYDWGNFNAINRNNNQNQNNISSVNEPLLTAQDFDADYGYQNSQDREDDIRTPGL